MHKVLTMYCLNSFGKDICLNHTFMKQFICVPQQIYRSVKRHHCYPPSWRRWVLFLLPGIVSAVIGVCVYVFAQTDSNYFYTHSIWHVMVATSVVFLLPPREKHVPPWGWTHKICGYKLCKNEKEELYVVTGT